jgi:CDP-glucose 4,6-dehydratase
LTLYGDVYRDRRVLLTGHTGFKGSWLALWLAELGARVTGLALAPPSSPSHWDLLGLPIDDRRQDIRDASDLSRLVGEAEPEIVFHLAAQPLIRRSYREPLETWSTNVMGTVNVLEACRHRPSVRAIVVVTTDKCYENRGWTWGYREVDTLGGHDPYSASKAAAELVVASYRSAYFSNGQGPLVASARAGNVIGGGDWSEDRLVPDLARAAARHAPLEIRFPEATRPWQHVLEPLAGYLLLGQYLLEERREVAEAWNFGPEHEGNRTVREVLEALRAHWPGITWQVSTEEQPHEATRLHLDSSKARIRLGWQQVWDLRVTLAETARWYRTFIEEGRLLSHDQLQAFVTAARTAGVAWCCK